MFQCEYTCSCSLDVAMTGRTALISSIERHTQGQHDRVCTRGTPKSTSPVMPGSKTTSRMFRSPVSNTRQTAGLTVRHRVHGASFPALPKKGNLSRISARHIMGIPHGDSATPRQRVSMSHSEPS
ncbi:hypothetical protein M8818_006042 [Zalaria obscura]|uniref:Uncharacterized protein n=1 Tax=Zalaria obscura TaxID=2024903 RepID=A0ACC3SB52_9PEZI